MRMRKRKKSNAKVYGGLGRLRILSLTCPRSRSPFSPTLRDLFLCSFSFLSFFFFLAPSHYLSASKQTCLSRNRLEDKSRKTLPPPLTSGCIWWIILRKVRGEDSVTPYGLSRTFIRLKHRSARCSKAFNTSLLWSVVRKQPLIKARSLCF